MIQTVNVIQHDGCGVQSIHSWQSDSYGNEEAEKFFTGVIKEDEPAISEEDISACLDNGHYEQGTFSVFLTHSETDK